jgi:plastocyanin
MLSRRTSLLFLLSLVLVALAGACGGGDGRGATASPKPSDTSSSVVAPAGGAAKGPIVSVKGMAFDPAKLRVKAGETVTWRFDDRAVAHNVVGDGFKSALKRSGTFSHTFAEPGSYPYRCTVHPGMKGSVVVS